MVNGNEIVGGKSGFTLVELLVVIAIIGILSTVLILQLSGARAKARNIKRNSDIKQLVTAFQAGFADTGSFPVSGWACVSASCYDGWDFLPNAVVDNFLAPYLPQKPVDPDDGSRGYGGYIYANPTGPWVGEDGSSYSGALLFWNVEPPTGPNICGPAGKAYSTSIKYIECGIKLD